MLDFEDDNRILLADKFGPQLDCARDLLAVGQQVAESLNRHLQESDGGINARSATVVSLVLAQLLRRCRAAILVWEFGYTREADVLARSLFDSHLAARFIIEPQLPQPHWTAHLRSEFNKLCDLSGHGISRFTDINFRAMLYAACETVKLDGKTDKFKVLPNFHGKLPSDFGDEMRAAAAEAETIIGREWADRIRKTGTFHGFSQIRLLAEYCGADKSHYYQTLYGIQSGSSHGEGAMLLMRNPTRDGLAQVLCLPCSILGESLEDFDRVFSLGYADKIRELADRILRVFQIGAKS